MARAIALQPKTLPTRVSPTRPEVVDAAVDEATATRVRLWPVLAVLVPGLLVACWAALPTTWDGASFLFRIAHSGDPEILHGRIGSVIWQVPAVAAARFGAPLDTIRATFSLGFVAAPVVALWCSWLVVRDRDPRLFACAACAILALSAPAQAFFVGEMLISLQLGWVLLLTAATGATTPWGRRLAIPVAVVILLTHPISAFVIAGAAGVLLVRWYSDGGGHVTRRQGTLVAGLVVLAVARMMLTNGYERANTKDLAMDVAFESIEQGGVLLLVGLLCVAAAVVTMAITVGTGRLERRWWVPFALLAAGGVALVALAADTAAWRSEVNWRVFDIVFMLPAFAALLVCVLVRAVPSPRARSAATAFAIGSAVLAAAVLVVQSVGWRDARADLRAEVRALPPSCVVFADLDSASAAPMSGHWATAMLALEEQGLRPRVVVMEKPGACRTYESTGAARVWPWESILDRGANGAFHLPTL